MATSTTATDGFKAAKQLVGSYAHLRPDQPEVFLASIAAVLAQYPLAVVQECVDPRGGIARKHEFLSIAKIVEWCDAKLHYYQCVSQYRPSALRKPEYVSELSDEDRALASKFLADLALELRMRTVIGRPKMPLPDVPTDEDLREIYPQREVAA